nr:immunoglobulin heavy chain junction region [Macaca mulatta]MOY22187.1 immunoglobulin heavy chain junction region [Macaca mulatta]MOY22612.1 immunoglobulin heavy chain junction region [Macaca mulatta]MOY23352.1 immunoglobulin heavy chain junction region [Macaca mulatta]MOY24323.1 immunoglobulin heavy chain junction region [Macaca mulatta]
CASFDWGYESGYYPYW